MSEAPMTPASRAAGLAVFLKKHPSVLGILSFVLLMDEPFGALDAHTREGLQAELIRLHEQMNKTVVFVTHDLDEAVLLADRVFVMSPVGTLAEIVEIPIPRPRSDPELIRTTPLFTEKRYHIWQTMRRLEVASRAGAAA